MNRRDTHPGVYARLSDLIRLKHKAQGFSFLPRQPVHSLLTGRHASRLRGRGLDFEEIRGYLPGDDIRSIDWKVTARTRKPHTRVYSEERERPVLLVVDQRLSMFFGTRVNMKSVTAAETAALAAWRVISSGDRVGAVIFNDEEIRHIRPHRSARTVMEILNRIIEFNHALTVDSRISPSPGALDRALEKTAHLARTDTLICIISDFSGITEDTCRHIKLMGRHNDIILGMIHDPTATDAVNAGTIVISDGMRQASLDSSDEDKRTLVREVFNERLHLLTEELTRYGVPVLPIHTATGAAEQIRDALGAR
ncbi:DUF58 domain-containing protein [Desulfoluna butyratoxydans]|uniref:von willebrand factor type a n=1 Tax=Desulfoluna butyratoxydans TaxID=231438 RepID=A0A4U8YUC7_9BACT|nr:DUF58 domain-containing protein [Desulfoluna butyratoxydans]VFQ47504.1 von willebrand factor type a [Desulfoluna butyratoxydans]